MKKLLFLFSLFTFYCSFAQETAAPEKVTVGVYINSIHNIDFKEKEYTISLWLWLKYKNKDFDFAKYLEVPMAKTVDKSFYTVDTLSDGRIYMVMKLQCVMKDTWEIQNFPFDQQKLRFSIENSQYGSDDLIFVKDTMGKYYSKWITSGWRIIPEKFKITTDIKKYQTSFGDPTLTNQLSEFSAFKVRIGLERDCWLLFLKLFIGMYIAFLLSFLCFFIHTDNIDSRFGLSVGSLFAVIGNKYVVDATLPETTSFTLVDILHSVTLCFVFLVVGCSVYSLKLIKKNKIAEAKRFDRMGAWILLFVYIVVNIWYIYNAYYSDAA